jgi:RNA polymerase sigma-70 factor (sigma-E family)
VKPADEGFEAFVRVRSAALLRRAYLLCAGDPGAAEDLLQDVLERMYPRWSHITEDPYVYARAALANAAANRWRRRARRVREEYGRDAPDAVAGHEHLVVDRQVTVRALAALPPRMRAVLVLRYFEDLSEAQTAEILGCRPGTVKSLAFRGLTRLRATLEHTYSRSRR